MVLVGYVWVWWVGANFSDGVVSSLASTSKGRPGERIASTRVGCCVVVVDGGSRGISCVVVEPQSRAAGALSPAHSHYFYT